MNDLTPADDFGPYNVDGNADATVDDFAGISPANTEHEIALVRYQIQRAINEGAPPSVIAQLSAVVGKLSREWTIAAVRSHKMVHVTEAMRFVAEVVADLSAAFADLPDVGERIDRVLARWPHPKNSKGQESEMLGRIR